MKVLKQGNIVSIMGDRSYGAHTVKVDFLNCEANFPFSAFHIGAMSNTPICFFIYEKTKYKTYIQDVFNNQRRLTKVTAFLPYKIFSSLKLNDLIQLGQNNYKINSLKTNLTNGKTEFELLNTIL